MSLAEDRAKESAPHVWRSRSPFFLCVDLDWLLLRKHRFVMQSYGYRLDYVHQRQHLAELT